MPADERVALKRPPNAVSCRPTLANWSRRTTCCPSYSAREGPLHAALLRRRRAGESPHKIVAGHRRRNPRRGDDDDRLHVATRPGTAPTMCLSRTMEFPKTFIFLHPFRVTNYVGWCRPVTCMGWLFFVTASVSQSHLSPEGPPTPVPIREWCVKRPVECPMIARLSSAGASRRCLGQGAGKVEP